MSDAPPERLVIVGGRQRAQALDLDEWHAYEKAIAVESRDAKSPQVVVDYETPPQFCASHQPSITFKAGDISKEGKRLLVCTQTEVLEWDTLTWKLTGFFTHPWFNDVHHVSYLTTDRIMVANTGLDQVLECELDRAESHCKVVQDWSVGDTPTWDRFDRDTDYRKVATTKPHQTHPNFVFANRDRWCVTRFHPQDVFEIQASRSAFQVAAGNPHDGIVEDGVVFLTTTNGQLCGFSLADDAECCRIDLNSIAKEPNLGWCRGLWINRLETFEHPVEGTHSKPAFLDFWVGFSRIRPTWLRKNLSWIKQGFQTKGQYGTLPTRVSRYRVEFARSAEPRLELVDEIPLEDAGLNAVFGIFGLPV